jgi:hypothetical protein
MYARIFRAQPQFQLYPGLEQLDIYYGKPQKDDISKLLDLVRPVQTLRSIRLGIEPARTPHWLIGIQMIREPEDVRKMWSEAVGKEGSGLQSLELIINRRHWAY